MIQFYQQNSLKEYFKEVDTTLRTPYKQPEDSNTPNNTPNTTPSTALLWHFNEPDLFPWNIVLLEEINMSKC